MLPPVISEWIRIGFRETPGFTSVLQEYFPDDESFRLLQIMLARDPEMGAVMPGCGGIRKVRWPDSRRGKGKRGGLRVIYLYVPLANNILLLDVYDKDESEDLSVRSKQLLRTLAEEYRSEVLAELRKTQ